MSPNDDLYLAACDNTVETHDWVLKLAATHPNRLLTHNQTKQFYNRRRTIEYSVKGTITASLSIALIWSGPPFWLIGGAGLILRLTTLLLNRFTPSDYIEKSQYEAHINLNSLKEAPLLHEFRRQWIQKHQNYFFAGHINELNSLEKRVGFALTAGFIIFTFVSANLTVPLALVGILFVDSLVHKAKESLPPFIEQQEELTNLFNPN